MEKTYTIYIAAILLSTQQGKSLGRNCSLSLSTIKHVSNCPQTESAFLEAEKRMDCSKYHHEAKCPKIANFKYHCVMNHFLNKTLEVCADTHFTQDYCPVFNEVEQQIEAKYSLRCGKFANPCPLRFNSTDVYKYGGCYLKTGISATTDDTTTTRVFRTTFSSYGSSFLKEKNRTTIIIIVCVAVGVFVTVTALISLFVCYLKGLYQCRGCRDGRQLSETELVGLLHVGVHPGIQIHDPQPTGTGHVVKIHGVITGFKDSHSIQSVVWKKDNADITIKHSKYHLDQGLTPSLTIQNAGDSDAGKYQCCVALKDETVLQSNVVFLDKPSAIIQGQQMAVYGSKVEFQRTSGSDITFAEWKMIHNNSITTIDLLSPKYKGSSRDPKNPKLVINNVGHQDERDYLLLIKNCLGEAESNRVQLKVTGCQPHVTISPPTKMGDNIVIHCYCETTKDSPKITSVSWKKNKTNLDTTEQKYSLDQLPRPSLTIHNSAATEDEGDYQCLATNAVGTAESNVISLKNVYGSIQGPTYIRCGLRAVFKLKCKTALYKAEWYMARDGTTSKIDLNDERYTGSKNDPSAAELVINEATKSDSATYFLCVQNCFGDGETDRITLKVTGEVASVNIPDVSEKGNDIIITVKCTQDLPTQTYTWLKNNEVIEVQNNPNKYSGGILKSPDLVIRNVDPNDAGCYKFLATNAVGPSKASNEIKLSKPMFSVHGPEKVIHGNTATLKAKIEHFLPKKCSWKWKKGADGIVSNIDVSEEKYRGSSVDAENPVLVINDVDFKDDAKYILEGTNRIGKTRSNGTNIKVTEKKPQVKALVPEYEKSCIKMKCKIDCDIDSPRVTSMKWSKDDKPIDKTLVSGEKTENLKIETADMSSVAQYTFTASNSFGATSCTIELKEQQMPSDE